MRFAVLILAIACFIQSADASVFKKKPRPQNNMPKTMQEYIRAVNIQADKNNEIPSPKIEKDKKLVDVPEPTLTVKKYNNPPGMVELDLRTLGKKRMVNSIGVASPSYEKLAFSTVYYYPATKTTASELYLMNMGEGSTVKERLANANVKRGKTTLFRSGMKELDLDIQRTLTILDWSIDGKRLAFKEKISHREDGTWKTNLYVYNFETNKVKELSEVREAIKYYWRTSQGLVLNDKRWDIFPLGWDALNPERIIVFAYAYTGEKPKYLGAWSVDFYGDHAMLMSLYSTDFAVSQNGAALKLNLPY